MSTPVLTLPAAGWYPDPVGAATYRWWDGESWTEGTHDGVATAAEAQPDLGDLELTIERRPALVQQSHDLGDLEFTVERAPLLDQPEPEPEPEPLFQPEPLVQPEFARSSFEPVVFENAVFEPATNAEPDLSFIEPMPIYAQPLTAADFRQPEALEPEVPSASAPVPPTPVPPSALLDFPAPGTAPDPAEPAAAAVPLAPAPAQFAAASAAFAPAAAPAPKGKPGRAPKAPRAAKAPTASAPPARRGVSPAKTRWSSLLTAYPFVYPFAVGMVVALGYAGGASGSTTTLAILGGGAALVLLAPAWIFADHDRRELVARGYEPAPSLGWMLLLPPIAYLIARRRAVGPGY